MNEIKLFKTQNRRGLQGGAWSSFAVFVLLLVLAFIFILIPLENEINKWAKEVKATSLDTQTAQLAFASSAHVDAGDVRFIGPEAQNELEHYFTLTIAGKPALGKCTVIPTKLPKCEVGYTNLDR